MNLPIAISFNIERQRLLDILTTAYEQGIAYWAQDDDFADFEATRDSEGYVTSIRVTRARGAKTPEFNPQVEATNNSALVTVPDLAVAIGKALSDEAARYSAAQEIIEGDFDAFTADVLVQFAFFGKVIYG